MINVPRLTDVVRMDDGNLADSGFGWWMWEEIVLLRCPKNHVCWLPHKIDVTGEVQPSAVCPVAGCGFHEFLHLDGWDAGERTRQHELAAAHQKCRDLGIQLADEHPGPTGV